MVEGESAEDKKELAPPRNCLPAFGPRPDTNEQYNFKEEILWLPFQFNLGNFHSQKRMGLIN